VVRRPRPDDPSVDVRVGTPSRLSFPSSHACSTTAAAVAYGGLLGPGWTARLSALLVPPMLLSRLVLGVHFPTDVLVGSVLGAAVAKVAGRVERRETR
jgi:membrane-associated phospholipid phosphatase